MKMGIIGAGLVAVMALSAVTATSAETETKGGWDIAGIHFANPLDSSTWWDGSTDLELDKAETVVINFADPDFWMSIPDVKKHSTMHKAFLNPATWAQFAKVETYKNMMDTSLLAKWKDPSTFAVLADPQTYTYRLQPGAFMHTFDARSYSQLVNPAAYGTILSTMLETAGLTGVAEMGKNAVTAIVE